jgi:hypothetical protein
LIETSIDDGTWYDTSGLILLIGDFRSHQRIWPHQQMAFFLFLEDVTVFRPPGEEGGTKKVFGICLINAFDKFNAEEAATTTRTTSKDQRRPRYNYSFLPTH